MRHWVDGEEIPPVEIVKRNTYSVLFAIDGVPYSANRYGEVMPLAPNERLYESLPIWKKDKVFDRVCGMTERKKRGRWVYNYDLSFVISRLCSLSKCNQRDAHRYMEDIEKVESYQAVEAAT